MCVERIGPIHGVQETNCRAHSPEVKKQLVQDSAREH